MKSILISVLIFSITLIFISCGNENQPTQNPSDVENPLLKRKPNPGGNPASDLITFVGDLTGSQVVEGCCPNAGPFPEYTMTLFNPLPSGTYGGQIFMNKVGKGINKSYMVQFWWTEIDDYFIEIRGGVFQEDKKTKTLIATFTDALCEIWINNDFTSTVQVTFTLTRAKL